MTHDDMPVIMYKTLACLYDCMNRGVDPQRSMLSHDGSMLSIPYRYWARIVAELAGRGYVTGFTATKDIAGGPIVDIRNPEITFEGVEFLQENSAMRRALEFLKDAKSALPFL